jgi:hypothetical protein
MTNSFIVAVWVTWITNTMDIFTSPAGDEMWRHTISSQRQVYTVPGAPTVTNTVAVATNSIHLRMTWVEVTNTLPPFPK